MAKINLDKYYTPIDIAKHCIDVVNGLHLDITEVIEPSAGNGSFSLQIPNCIAYDIEPEHEGIIKQDFLKLKLPYKQGRLFIGNPPFGNSNSLSIQFYKHACKMGDYIAFIQPISQLENNMRMYHFDLIHSEALPVVEFSGRKLLCCFNVYKRPDKGVNEKPIHKLKDVFVGEYRRGGSYKKPKHFDFAMNTFGGSVGKEVTEIGTYCQESYLIIHNEKYKKRILDLMRNTDWNKVYPSTSTPKVQNWKIYKYLKQQIPELE